MPRLFSAGQIPVDLHSFKPGTEDRRGADVKIVTMDLVVLDFDAQMAASIDEGLGGDSHVRRDLFELASAEPKAHIDRVSLSLGCPRQTLTIYAAPDVEKARLVLTQCKISDVSASKPKGGTGYELKFKAAFGPVGPDDLAVLLTWFGFSQFVTFEASEPFLVDEQPDARPVDGRPLPGWDDGTQDVRDHGIPLVEEREAAEADAVREVAARPVKARGTRKKAGRHDPEKEAKAQKRAGKTAAAQAH